jgi:LPS export ABC transporter protein LptC
MRWQKIARLAIATFVVVFAGVVFFTMRQRAPAPAAGGEEVERVDRTAAIENTSGGVFENSENGRLRYRLTTERHIGYADGRHRFAGVTLTLPDRDDKTVTVTADEAYVTGSPGTIEKAEFAGHVRLTSSDGLEIRTASANYTEANGVLHVPGPVEFTRGRMKGNGVGATYDKTRDVLWLLDQAHITVAADPTGAGAADATAGTAGLARTENYLKLTRHARVVSDGRTITADDLTARLKADGETLERLELRGSSGITETGAAPRTMRAADIDLVYASDGRTLQAARLLEQASVDLPGAGGAAGRRISGRTIDMTMGPDGSTLTALEARENVQVDLPGGAQTPGKQIRASALSASGTEAGLTNATFAGGVEYRETRAAKGQLAAIDRTARSAQLILSTAPGLGDIERADFRGRFTFTDAAQVTAEAPRALYHVAGDRIDLSAGAGEPGPAPTVNDGQFLVQAANIQLSPDSRKLTADTNVRSTIQPQRRAQPPNGGGTGPVAPPDQTSRMPVMLDEDRPVYVAANRLVYDGTAEATYSGKARLWQDESQSKIDADTIVLNDRTGNLIARTNVTTTMLLQDVDPATKQKKTSQTVATADELVYDDAKRLAVYTGTPATRATMKGVYGDVVADRIDMYLKEGGNELERAEAHGRVIVTEGGRQATGEVLIYTSENDTYVMTGNPVEAIERDTPQTCKKTTGSTLTFRRSVGSIRAETNGLVPVNVVPVACPAERRN